MTKIGPPSDVDQRITLDLPVVGAPDREVAGRPYAPTSVVLDYRRRPCGTWRVIVTLIGPRVRWDGAVGNRVVSETRQWPTPELPEWLDAAVLEHHPAADAVMALEDLLCSDRACCPLPLGGGR